MGDPLLSMIGEPGVLLLILLGAGLAAFLIGRRV